MRAAAEPLFAEAELVESALDVRLVPRDHSRDLAHRLKPTPTRPTRPDGAVAIGQSRVSCRDCFLANICEEWRVALGPIFQGYKDAADAVS